MIQIRSLTKLDRDRYHELASGYESPAKYHIRKIETEGEIIISMSLEHLEKPYLKRWIPDQEEDSRYAEIIGKGYSAGAYDEDRLIGIAIAEKQDWNRTFLIWEFHIDSEYRRRGIGRQFMEHMAKIGQGANCRVMVCETQNTNVPAIRFYQNVGFEVGGIDLSYYTNSDMVDFEVAVFMKRFIE